MRQVGDTVPISPTPLFVRQVDFAIDIEPNLALRRNFLRKLHYDGAHVVFAEPVFQPSFFPRIGRIVPANIANDAVATDGINAVAGIEPEQFECFCEKKVFLLRDFVGRIEVENQFPRGPIGPIGPGDRLVCGHDVGLRIELQNEIVLRCPFRHGLRAEFHI